MSSVQHGDDVADRPLFDPPLYIQRLAIVTEILKEHGCREVLDFGCGDGKLLGRLRMDESFSRLVGVDIDDKAVMAAAEQSEPLMSEYLSPRLKPMKLSLFVGSVSDADARCAGMDGAACVEVYV